jgi:hypothetical protein
MSGHRLNRLTRFVAWLRAGYPADVPRFGYISMLGLLPRNLGDRDIAQIADKLIDEATKKLSPITHYRIGQMIERTVLQHALPEDVDRVTAQLAARGWLLAAPPITNE